MIKYFNSSTSISILSRLTNPNSFDLMILIEKLCKLIVRVHIAISNNWISNRQYLIDVFVNYFFIKLSQRFIKVTLVRQMIITRNFSVYLSWIDFVRNMILLPLCPEEIDLFELNMTLIILNPLIPTSSLKNLSYDLMVVACWISIIFEYYFLVLLLLVIISTPLLNVIFEFTIIVFSYPIFCIRHSHFHTSFFIYCHFNCICFEISE